MHDLWPQYLPSSQTRFQVTKVMHISFHCHDIVEGMHLCVTHLFGIITEALQASRPTKLRQSSPSRQDKHRGGARHSTTTPTFGELVDARVT